MGSCASQDEVKDELPEVDYRGKIHERIFHNISWDPHRFTTKRIKHGECNYYSGLYLASRYVYHYGPSYSYQIEMQCGLYCGEYHVSEFVLRDFLDVMRELRRFNEVDYNGFEIPSHFVFPCRDKKTQIAKMYHNKYFKKHVEEELIAYVCHPSRYHTFEDLGFFDN
jgi:hypothetical protein